MLPDPRLPLTTLSNYAIRPLGDEELGLLEQHIPFDWANLKKHRQRLEKQREGKAAYLVAWIGSRPLGHALIEWDGTDDPPIADKMRGCPDLQDIFVCPDFRSRGIGTRLLTAADHLARLRGYGRVGMGVDITNTRARALYDRRGYRDAGSGEYQIRWKYTDRNGEERWAEECCNYLIKDI